MKRSLSNRIDRYAQAQAPKPAMHLVWVDWWGPGFDEKRDAMIASGRAKPTDEFIRISWLPPLPEEGK
jgi:hypothetical protein